MAKMNTRQDALTQAIAESRQRSGTTIPPIPALGTRTQPTIPIPIPLRNPNATVVATPPVPTPPIPTGTARPVIPRSILIAVPRQIVTQVPIVIIRHPVPQPTTPRFVVPPPIISRPTVPPPIISRPTIPPPIISRPTIPPPIISRPMIPPPTVPQPMPPQPTVPQPMPPQPTIPRPTIPQPTISPVVPPVTRSPGRMTEAEEEQMRLAIKASLEETGLPTPVKIPPRNPVLSPTTEQEEIEEALLQAAIDASMRATKEAQLATLHANQAAIIPASPRRQQVTTTRELRAEQDREYEESLRRDQEKAENARLAAEAAARAAAAAEEATRKLQEVRAAEEAKKETLQPPMLQYPIEGNLGVDIYTIRFKLPTGATIMHSFHRDEPLSSVLQQLRFDLKHTGSLSLTIPPGKLVTCSETTPISACGFSNRIVINVDYLDTPDITGVMPLV